MSEDEKGSASYHPPWERRGTDLSRILSLSDGIFGFAMTLLVLSIALPVIYTVPGDPGADHPTLFAVLSQLQGALAAYVLVFVVLASYWRSHNLLFTYLRGWDQAVIQLNMLFLALVVLQPFLVHVITTYPGNFEAVVVYSAISGLTGLALCALWSHATSHRRLLHRRIDDEGIRWLRTALYLSPAVFGAAIAIAFVNPSLAEFAWLGVFVIQIAHVHRARTRRPGSDPVDARPAGERPVPRTDP